MQTGDVVGARFAIEALAGRGGMADVYRARDATSGATVALKVLHQHEQAGRLEREGRVLRLLQHPTSVAFVDAGTTDDGRPYLVMEWVEGTSLADHLAAHGPLSLDDALALGQQLAQGVGAAHLRGVVHRDLKPQNLLLTGPGVAGLRILDFGIAHLTEDPRLTWAGTFVGTPSYTAPEQTRDDATPSARMDVYSIGCVLYHCLAGVPPFDGAHVIAVLTRVLFEEPPRVRDLRPELPAAVDALLRRLLAKAPADRPADGNAVAEELAALRERLGAGAAPGGEEVASVSSERRLFSIVLARGALTGPLGDEVAERIAEFGGSIDRAPDGAMVVAFREGTVASDQAVRAVRAAMALRAADPSCAVAVATGFGEMRGRLPVGVVAERAAQLLDDAGAAVALDETTAGLVAGRFSTVPAADGLRHEVTAEIPETHAAAGIRRSGPFAGRTRELGQLLSHYDEGRHDSVSQLIVVTGSPGIGKTRLSHELVTAVRTQYPDAAIWRARADWLTTSSAFALLRSLIAGVIGTLDGPDADGVPPIDRVRALVERRVAPAERARVAEVIGEVIGVRFPSSPLLETMRHDPSIASQQVERAWLDLLSAETAGEPLLLMLDDLHWADGPSLRLVGTAVRALREKPLIVLGFARPEMLESARPVFGIAPSTQIALRELDVRAARQLVRSRLGDDAADATIDEIVRRSGGNPFFLEELVRVQVEHQRLDVPESVLAMVEVRYEALEPALRLVLRMASIFGQSFPVDGVADLAGMEEEGGGIGRYLWHLAEREIVREAVDAAGATRGDYEFRHALLRDAAYAMLPERERKTGHVRAAEWLQAAGRLEPATIAFHFDEGGDLARAATWYAEAADATLAWADLETVVRHTARGLACDPDRAARGQLLAIETAASLWRANLPRVLECGPQALELVEPGTKAWSLCNHALALTLAELGEVDRFRELARNFAAAEPHETTRPYYVQALGMIGIAHVILVDRAAAQSCAARMLSVFGDDTPDPHSRGWSAYVDCNVLGLLVPSPAEALVAAQVAEDCFRRVGDQRMWIGSCAWLGMVEAEVFGLARGEATMRAAIATIEPGEARVTSFIESQLAFVLACDGPDERLAEAAALATAVAERVGPGVPSYYGVAAAALAHAARRRGDHQAAAAHVAGAMRAVGPLPGLAAVARSAELALAVDTERWAEARVAADHAIALLDRIGHGGYAAPRMQRDIARVYAHEGDAAQAAAWDARADARAAAAAAAAILPA